MVAAQLINPSLARICGSIALSRGPWATLRHSDAAPWMDSSASEMRSKDKPIRPRSISAKYLYTCLTLRVTPCQGLQRIQRNPFAFTLCQVYKKCGAPFCETLSWFVKGEKEPGLHIICTRSARSISAVCSALTRRQSECAERLPDQTTNSFLSSSHMFYGFPD